MSLSDKLAIAGAVAAALAYLATPVAILTARRFAFYDKPAGYKGHGRPTPYLGGAAVMLAFALAAIIGAGRPGRTLPLLGGVVVLLVVGTIDDRRTVSPGLRVAIELAIGVLLSLTGLGWQLGAGGVVDAAVTAVWVVAVVNSFNLFDNMDGAATTMGAVVSGAACVLAISTGAAWAAVGSAALCGACLGFLPHNLLARPARIFLGDGGSMPLGFAVAALVASAARSAEPSSLSLLVGFLLVGVPAVDTCLVIVSRRRRGISILTGGQDHLTHRTRRRVRTASRVALVLGSAQALVSALVIVATHGTPTTLVYVLLAFVVAASATIGALESVDDVRPAGNFAPAGPSPVPAGAPAARPGRLSFDRISLVVLALLGFGAGVSALFEAYYGTGVWTPIGLGLVAAAAAAVVARPPRLAGPAIAALAALFALGGWSLLSTLWSPTVESATLDANRWLVYAALVLLAVVLIRGRRHALALLAGAGAGIGLTAAVVIVRLLGPGGPAMFLGGRLDLPLGYINGQGAVFAMGGWLAFALAERRGPVAAGVGAGATVVLADLTLMSQSRGAAVAVFVALLVAVLAIPGRRRRLLALAVVAAGVAAGSGPVLDVYSQGVGRGIPPAGVLHSAVGAMLLAGLAAGLAWGLITAVERRASHSGSARRRLHRLATVAAVAVVVVPAVAAVVASGRIERTVRSQWHAFVHLSDAGGVSSSSGAQTRLLSGAGNRYDYWRVAWHLFTAHPLAGAGAGGYPVAYYRTRQTTEAIENPHSIELELLAELGVVGLALLVAVVTAGVLGARRWGAAARDTPAARTLLVASAGVAVTWLVDASGDWLHLLPGASAVALAALAVLAHPQAAAGAAAASAAPSPGRRPSGVRVIRVVAAAAVGFALALAGASLMRTGLSQIYLDAAQGDLAHDPAAALTNANRALRLDGANLNSYYIKAAALARFDEAAAARSVLLQAAREEPTSFVTWTLLGDLQVRTGDLSLARHYYRLALGLDPHEPSLAALVADPRSALAGTSGR